MCTQYWRAEEEASNLFLGLLPRSGKRRDFKGAASRELLLLKLTKKRKQPYNDHRHVSKQRGPFYSLSLLQDYTTSLVYYYYNSRCCLA